MSANPLIQWKIFFLYPPSGARILQQRIHLKGFPTIRQPRTEEGGVMCDYSLGGLPNRLAVDGEELTVHRFSTGSIGLAACCDVHPAHVERPLRKKSVWESIRNFFAEVSDEHSKAPAVCIPPGAQLILKSVPLDLRR